jgi:hypothetical protein
LVPGFPVEIFHDIPSSILIFARLPFDFLPVTKQFSIQIEVDMPAKLTADCFLVSDTQDCIPGVFFELVIGLAVDCLWVHQGLAILKDLFCLATAHDPQQLSEF